jgi:photosystem II stability/assembly factor-like uncharacterized protein
LRRLPSGTTADLSDVDFVNAETGWAVGGYGSVLSTVDGGRTWRSQRVGTTPLSGVDFVDAEHGWAVGKGGVVLVTSDGGRTWSRQTVPRRPDLSKVVATDRTHAWVLGAGEAGSIVLGTTDGATWSKLMTYQAGHWDYLADLTFTDQRHGWAVGSKGAILATDDGGRTWSRQRSGTSLQLSHVCSLDSRRGWVVGFAGEDMPRPIVLSTADGGMTWVRRSVGSRGTMVLDVAFSDATHGWAVAGYRRNVSVISPVWVCLRTSDGGATWTAQEVTHQSLSAVDSWGPSLVWAVGSGGRVYGRRR